MKRVSSNLRVKCLETFSSAVVSTEKYSGEETVVHAVHTSWGPPASPGVSASASLFQGTQS